MLNTMRRIVALPIIAAVLVAGLLLTTSNPGFSQPVQAQGHPHLLRYTR